MPHHAPFISVVVPTYNLARYTAEALQSARDQTFADFEVVVVDDGSTDNTVEVVETFLADPRFALIRQENRGTAAARNTAISRARGEWVAFLDCDDLWLPEKLEKQAQVIEAHPGAALIFTNGVEFTQDGDFGPFYRKREVFPDGVGLRRVLECNCFWACSVMVRRRDVLDVGMLRSDLPGVDDYDLWLKILERGGEPRGVWEPVTRYRKRADSQGVDKAVMYGRLLRVYEDARDRIVDPELKTVAERCVARVRSDLLMVKARRSVDGESIDWRACRSHLYKAWREYPRRAKPIGMLIASVLGRRKSVVERLARKW